MAFLFYEFRHYFENVIEAQISTFKIRDYRKLQKSSKTHRKCVKNCRCQMSNGERAPEKISAKK